MELTYEQYNIVYNMLSLTVAVMAASGIYFIATANRISARYRPAMYVSALIVFVAAYHYFRIFGSWEAAFEFTGSGGVERAGTYVPAEGASPFNEAYRYADWLLTVPLLIVELYIVIQPRGTKGKSMTGLTGLLVATVGMLLTGYIGEVSESQALIGARGFWGTVSSVFFAYIVYKLWTDVGAAMEGHLEGKARTLAGNTRLLLLFTWGFYPIVYLIPMFTTTGATGEVGLQVGYSVADLAAKAGYGLLIHHIAHERTLQEEGRVEARATVAA